MKKLRTPSLLASTLLVISAFGAEAQERGQVSASPTGGTRSAPSSSSGSSSGSGSSTRSSSHSPSSHSPSSTSSRGSSRSSSGSASSYSFSATGRSRPSRGSSSWGGGGGSHGGHHGGGHWGGGWYSPRYSSTYFDAWYFPYWCSVGWWWGLGYWGRPYSYVTVVERPGRYGRIDLDVSPEEAEVHLNGKYIGTADDFDGYPDYLYLKPGHYTLEFKLGGHVGVKKEVEVERGDLIRFGDELAREPGRGRLDSFTPESKGMP
ncbi:MAG: PEGA domain-containing protein, partial [Acidobacteria bacterium]|nr:PEGA domain-containing protein [Acidobacteriota bacterium]